MPISNIDPKRALEYLKKRGKKLLTSEEWDNLFNKSHDTAFTIAKVMSADILQMFFDLIEKAKNEGWTLEDFQKEAQSVAEKAGWTGNIKHRLKIIYKTNLGVAFAKGKYEEQKLLAEKGLRPYLKYLPSTSEEQNPLHKVFYNKVFRFDDPIWNIILPPSRFGCECSVRSVSQKEVDESKIKVERGTKVLLDIAKDPILRKELKAHNKSRINVLGTYKPKLDGYNVEISNQLKLNLKVLNE